MRIIFCIFFLLKYNYFLYGFLIAFLILNHKFKMSHSSLVSEILLLRVSALRMTNRRFDEVLRPLVFPFFSPIKYPKDKQKSKTIKQFLSSAACYLRA